MGANNSLAPEDTEDRCGLVFVGDPLETHGDGTAKTEDGDGSAETGHTIDMR